MGRGKALLFAVATLATSPAALAQQNSSCQAKEAEARELAFDGEKPFAAATTLPGMYVRVDGGDCRILTFYMLTPRIVPTDAAAADFRHVVPAYRGQLAPTRFLVRFVDDQETRKWQARWADERNCPQLRPAITQLDSVLAPNFAGNRPYRGVTDSVTDQQTYRFSSLAPHGPPYDFEHELQIDLQSPPEAPFGKWFEATLALLDTCWSSLEPTP